MSEKQDYYELLGVPRDVGADDLKKAFRKKALECHPDRNQSPGAEEEFKAINTAYAVLSDPNRRANYDRFGHDAPGGIGDPFSGGVRPDDLRDIFGGDAFDQLFGQFFRRRPSASHGRDQRVALEITLETIAKGGDYELTYQRRCPCEVCGGTGAAPGTQPVPCPACRGTGQIRRGQGFISIMQTCPQCHGRGVVIPTPCPACNGDGVGVQKVTIEITVPPGINDGHTLRLDGEGHHGLHGGQPGDLYVALSVAEHPFFDREGDHIVCEVPVSISQAALGTVVDVPTLNGRAKVKVPAGTQSGKKLRLKGKGLPNIKTQRSGDQLVRLQVETPTKLSAEQRACLEEYDRLFGGPKGNGSTPRQSSFLEKLRDFFG